MAKKLKQNHFCFYLQNRPLKFGLKVIYTPKFQRSIRVKGERILDQPLTCSLYETVFGLQYYKISAQCQKS